MPSRFIYKGIPFTVARRYDDLFEIAMLLDGQSLGSKVRTRLPELAKRRAEMLIDRKVRDKAKAGSSLRLFSLSDDRSS